MTLPSFDDIIRSEHKRREAIRALETRLRAISGSLFERPGGLTAERLQGRGVTPAEFGNIGPAGVPTVLSKALVEGRIEKGDKVLLGGIGSGINCTADGVIW